MANPDVVAKALARAPLFSELPEAELKRIAAHARPTQCKAKQVIVRRGEESVQLFVVVSGRLKATSEDWNGNVITLSIMGAGEVFGELGLLDGEVRSATVTAIEPCELMVIARADFLEQLRSRPELAIQLLASLTARVRYLSDRLQDAAYASSAKRLATQLINLCDGHGRSQGAATRIEVELGQQDLAQLVGATRESVNRQLRRWVSAGYIAKAGSSIVVTDLEALREIADHD